MYSNTHRLVESNYGSVSDFIAAAQRSAASIVQDAATGAGEGALGVWVDDSRKGIFMRVLRPHELDIGQSIAWRPHRLFPLDKVADEGLMWIAQKLRGIK